MKILLTGVTGQVGWELQRTLMTLGEVIAVGRNPNNTNWYMDLAQPDSIRHLIREVRPDLIVNPAAYTAVDKAESEPDLAMAINGIAPGVMAEEAKRLGAAIIHYSTDYVFDGTYAMPYTESDKPDPQNIYGKTKLAGEQAIAAVDVPHLVLRTSWVYGGRGKNFLLTMLKLAREREEIRVVDDQIGAPTWSRMIAEVTAQILAQASGNVSSFLASKSGIYHLSASGQTSWYGFAKSIFAHDPKRSQLKLKILTAIASSEYPTAATRPAYSLLNSQKLSHTFGITLPHWQKTLELVLASHCSIP
ncbi:dTDP-4-dehydrorhamnose reductase [Fischerella thermalis CCMEE 5198]|jgi:dTDP-4-dehydrorhamnose reductase|uniref:dTDP-4-dehydrorhamnose reductase n=1 Tax=Fischerella thermalis TaxID=372787 RepID=UPI000C801198|nr:dTDP-4-dehydrorhamnose reductase [Fischerella thermalis]PLZ95785.1 dTDP-4-dehydrorhamnose reductase [Fischerella thermalis CCMEE 5196]PMB20426.1 dTDP-4-dehydrorhamnose reductase [Fischerella thermalis CCMEE 5198]PMB54139.1 dTDP-4-dehydrorhamnose reductase [Fischerella thermalis CCMEE 5201]